MNISELDSHVKTTMQDGGESQKAIGLKATKLGSFKSGSTVGDLLDALKDWVAGLPRPTIGCCYVSGKAATILDNLQNSSAELDDGTEVITFHIVNTHTSANYFTLMAMYQNRLRFLCYTAGTWIIYGIALERQTS